jgi:hypothetical protein
MKRKISIFAILLVLSMTLAFQGCVDREPVPFVEQQAFTIPALVAPANGAFIDLPATAKVDLKWSSEADGDAQNWDVYFGPSEEPAKVATGYTSQSYTVNVVKGMRYYWRVIGYDSNHIPTRSEVWSFEIIDPNAPLKLYMSWTTDILDKIGIDVAPDEAANLRLKVLDENKDVVDIINTNGFESFEFDPGMPDGTYYIVTDVYSTVNAGDFNAPINISVDLTYSQRGIMSGTIPSPNIMTNQFTCDSYFATLVGITKTGNDYQIEPVSKAEWFADIDPFVGSWTVEDQYGFVDDIEITKVDDHTLSITGLGFDMIQNWWGEPVQASDPAIMVFDWNKFDGISIALQYHFTTMWAGDLYDYDIEGSGSLNMCAEAPELVITYDIAYSDGSMSIGDYLGEWFTVTVPYGGGKGTITSGTKGIVSRTLPPVPVKH